METDLVFWANAQPVMGFAIGVFMVIVYFVSGQSNATPLRIPEHIDTGIGLREIKPQTVDHSAELRALRAEIAQLRRQEKPKPKPKPKKEEPKQDALIQDCILALEGLGEKRSAARSTVNRYFNSNPNTKTVDEFIGGVFQR